MSQPPVPIGWQGRPQRLVEIVEGWTAPLITSSTAVVSVDGLLACSRAALLYSTEDFVAARSPYALRFRVEDADGRVVFAPSADPLAIRVRSV